MKTIELKFLTVFSFYVLLSGFQAQSANAFTTKTDNALDSLLTPISKIESAFSKQRSDFTVTVKGKVTKLLKDDIVGHPHQRFIIKMSNGRTMLIAHNIDIAPRVKGIKVGSIIYVHGDYVWNSEGGLIHWTHHDPDGDHENGWIMHGGKKYQ